MKILHVAGALAALLLFAAGVGAAEPTPAQRKAVEAYADKEERAYVERTLLADLNGDGKPEVLAEINWSMGNSYFGRLVVFADSGRGLQPVARSEEGLGQVRQVSVENGLIHVQSMWLAPNDARCCPSIEKTTRYRLQGNKVVEVETPAVAAKPSASAGTASAAPLPPLNLVAGYYATRGDCRDEMNYFFYDGKRTGVLTQLSTRVFNLPADEYFADVVPVAELKKSGKWLIPDPDEPGWAVQVQAPTRILLSIQDEVPASLCPLNEVSAWARKLGGL